MASGNELLTVSGRVINPSAKEQQVPPLEAKLTNKSGKLVYRWVIPPPAHALAAGTSAAFNSAEVKSRLAANISRSLSASRTPDLSY